jgi:hypothetical protein
VPVIQPCQIYCACKVSLSAEPNQKPGEFYCARCMPCHRALMQFMLAKDGWSVSFLEEGCKTSFPRHFAFQSELKILDLAKHGAPSSTSPAVKRSSRRSAWGEVPSG